MTVSTMSLSLAVHRTSVCAMMASDALERVQRLDEVLLGIRGNGGHLAAACLERSVAQELARKIARAAISEDEYQNVCDYLAADAIAHGPWVLRSDSSVGAEYAELLDIEPIVDETWSEDTEDWSLLALLLTARGPGLAKQYSGIPAVYRAQQEAIQRIADAYGVISQDVLAVLK